MAKAGGDAERLASPRLEPGSLYRRRALHEEYGGQQRGGISTPAAAPLIFLFTGESGNPFGYSDWWEKDLFHYYGEGQRGDMTFRGGNKAIRDHTINGKALYLFQMISRAGWVRYIDEMVCVGHDEVPNVPDVDGRPRTAMVFRLKRVGLAD